jgi:hypothetical protein
MMNLLRLISTRRIQNLINRHTRKHCSIPSHQNTKLLISACPCIKRFPEMIHAEVISDRIIVCATFQEKV